MLCLPDTDKIGYMCQIHQERYKSENKCVCMNHVINFLYSQHDKALKRHRNVIQRVHIFDNVIQRVHYTFLTLSLRKYSYKMKVT